MDTRYQIKRQRNVSQALILLGFIQKVLDRISAGVPTILIEISRGFSQTLQTNIREVPQTTTALFHNLHNSLHTNQPAIDTILSELLTAQLNKPKIQWNLTNSEFVNS